MEHRKLVPEIKVNFEELREQHRALLSFKII